MLRQLLGGHFTSSGGNQGANRHVNLRGNSNQPAAPALSLDVFEEARVRHRGSVLNDQFLADIAGEVVVVGFPAFVRGFRKIMPFKSDGNSSVGLLSSAAMWSRSRPRSFKDTSNASLGN